jgi:integrase
MGAGRSLSVQGSAARSGGLDRVRGECELCCRRAPGRRRPHGGCRGCSRCSLLARSLQRLGQRRGGVGYCAVGVHDVPQVVARAGVVEPSNRGVEAGPELVGTAAAGAGAQFVGWARLRLARWAAHSRSGAIAPEDRRASKDIAAALRLSKATISYHLIRLGAEPPREYQGRRAICGTLARSGIRASQLCDLRVGEVRHTTPTVPLPDPRRQNRGRRTRGADEPGACRGVRRALRPPAPPGPAHRSRRLRFPNTRGGRTARQRVAQIVGQAAARASEQLTGRGFPPLPHTTPHTLRRTYISIALLANCFDVLWVMGQVGHADSKMTMDVYAQLQQRVKREHGRAFDRLVRQAREPLYGTASGLPEAMPEPNLGHESGHEDRLRATEPLGRDAPPATKRRSAGRSRSGETRTRSGDTTIFSHTVRTLERC